MAHDLALPTGIDPTAAAVVLHPHPGPDAVRAATGGSTSVTVEVINGTDHFLAGAVARTAERTVAWLTALD